MALMLADNEGPDGAQAVDNLLPLLHITLSD